MLSDSRACRIRAGPDSDAFFHFYALPSNSQTAVALSYHTSSLIRFLGPDEEANGQVVVTVVAPAAAGAPVPCLPPQRRLHEAHGELVRVGVVGAPRSYLLGHNVVRSLPVLLEARQKFPLHQGCHDVKVATS